MITDLIKQIEQIKSNLYAKILSLPENDKITILQEHPKCFTIRFKDVVGKPLSPEYYCFESQYKMIVGFLERCRIENFEVMLQKIVETGKVPNGRANLRGQATFDLNPEVLTYLKSIL